MPSATGCCGAFFAPTGSRHTDATLKPHPRYRGLLANAAFIDGPSRCSPGSALDRSGIYVWDGNYYALAVTQRLGLEGKGGMVRAGAAHYNTLAEIDKLVNAVKKLIF